MWRLVGQPETLRLCPGRGLGGKGATSVKVFDWDELPSADLVVDACYRGRRGGNAGDDPLSRLVGVSNQGGFRILGTVERQKLVVITSTLSDPDWPDALDLESGTFTYFGDNKNPGTELHGTRRWGNRLLRDSFAAAHAGEAGRKIVPPILVFSSAGTWRDVLFRGLAVPGAEGLSQVDDLVAIWKSKDGQRFQNYRAVLTILDTPVVSRGWLNDIKVGNPLSENCPRQFRSWVEHGTFSPLRAKPSVEIRIRDEQLPSDELKQTLLRQVRDRYSADPFAFEAFACRIAKLHLSGITSVEVTPPRRDGGRDAIGLLRLGTGASSILLDFALEAKCYAETNSVGVKEMSRLISRLRHRQFGIMVTTSYVHSQAYSEIKEDDHPIIVISGGDLVDILVQHGISTPQALDAWIHAPE